MNIEASKQFVANIIAAADIEQVIAAHIEIKKVGRRTVACCPFHDDTGTHLTINTAKQFFHCSDCKTSGNAIDFLSKFHKMDFGAAANDLGGFLGINGEFLIKPVSIFADLTPSQAKLIHAQTDAADHFAVSLRASPNAMAYLNQRGLSDAVIEELGIGYAPPGWKTMGNIYEDHTEATLLDAGLLIKRESGTGHYDRFRDRIMFPIRNVSGLVIAFGGRVLDAAEEPKYLNSPETGVFSKSHELYGLYEAMGDIRAANFVLVTEGYMDVTALRQHGVPNAVATLGTATSGEHIKKLLHYTRHIVYSFDGDRAGRKAAWRAFESALPHMHDDARFSFLFLPDAHDPDSFIRTNGHDAFRGLIDIALSPDQYFAAEMKERFPQDTHEARMQMLAEAATWISAMPMSDVKRRVMVACAELCQVTVDDLMLILPGEPTDTLEPTHQPVNR